MVSEDGVNWLEAPDVKSNVSDFPNAGSAGQARGKNIKSAYFPHSVEENKTHIDGEGCRLYTFELQRGAQLQ